MDLSVVSAVAFLAALVSCELLRRWALRRALVDLPNERSLHSVPTPRLGGVALVSVALAVGFWRWSSESTHVHAAMLFGAGISVVGLIDDIRPLSAGSRFLVQAAGAVAFLWVVGVPGLSLTRHVVLHLPPIVTGVLLVMWIVGALNIFNFMDGMDGLAGFQTVSAALAYAVLWGDDVVFFVCALAAAAAGFLAHNFPPARIFMGDAGSTFVGASFACLAVAGIHRGIPLAQSALPLTPFLLDGTFTILRRLSKREPIWKPHRTHLYQRAVQTGLGHREVLLVYLAWMALALAATLAGSRGDVALGLGWASAMGCLFAVWRWVALRESQKLALS